MSGQDLFVEYSLDMDFPDALRETLANTAGLSYRRFRPTLSPRYGLGLTLLLCGHAALLLVIKALTVAWQTKAPALILVPAGALALGYGMAYLQLFFHEAAHHNLAASRRLNDWLANALIGAFTGQDIRRYRLVHFDHHRKLGTPDDTEISYFDPLNLRFLAEGLCGVKAFKVFARRQARLQARSSGGYAGPQLVVGILLNGLIVGSAVAANAWPVGLAWALGVSAVYPFLNALRQTLEHRGEHARPREDYRRTAHGAIHRLFGDGPLSSTFGGAGFNRHLLHHWEPQIPFTRLKELEAYLQDTPLARRLRERTTSYPRAFARLWSSGH